ncbi:MAG: NUDIX hydrolase, partial [Actinomycetota bacterium]|nr:NUDIX hydrolase [Actinomycetota bacterium]
MEEEFVLAESKLIYKGKIISLYLDKIKSPSGQILDREVVKHLDAVGVAALNEKKEIILVRQYRHPINKTLLEIPAGLLEDCESPAACAIRELREETGYVAKKVEKLAEFYTSAGFTDEKFYLYFTEEIEEGEPARELGEEDIKVEAIQLKEALDMAASGKIEDAKTLLAILMAALRAGHLEF